jgi:heme exporter protein D
LEKSIKIVRNWFELDDDSFSYWRLSERVPRPVFDQLYRSKAIYRTGEGERTVWAVNPLTAIQVLEKCGYVVENKEKVLKEIEEEKKRDERIEQVKKLAYSIERTCPKCGGKLQPGRWGQNFIVLSCFKCLHEEIFSVNEKNEVKLEWEGKYNENGYFDTIERLEHPEEYQKKKEEEEKKRILSEAWWKIKMTEGECPRNPDGSQIDFPKGEVLTDKIYPPDIYGGGVWYVIQDDYIWIIENNGADGDNWSLNNIKTGGAGAIGKRCKRTPELEKMVRLRASLE